MSAGPSPYALEQAMSALLATRQRLLQEDPDLASDERLFSDMLEGESGDAMDILHRVLRSAVYAEDMADAIGSRIDDLKVRHARFVGRSQALRGAAFAALDALGLPKLELPDLSASVRAGQPAVVITDEAALPDEMFRTTRAPNRTAIGEALRAGTEVPGAGLSNNLPSIQIRTK